MPAIETFAMWIWQTSWQAAILAGLVIALRAILGRSLSPAWKCSLWVIVGLRLVLPGIFSLPVPLPTTSSPTIIAAPQPVTSDVTVRVRILPGIPAAVPAIPIAHHSPALTNIQWLTIAYATVALIVAIRIILSNLRIAIQIRPMRRADDWIENLLHECAAELHLARSRPEQQPQNSPRQRTSPQL